MNCPDCGTALEFGRRDGVAMQVCATCSGMWLTADALQTLEDETFRLGDDEKGTLVFSSESSRRGCPECGVAMQRFAYRLYDLELEFCDAGHGFWLEAGEDKRVLDLMREEQARLQRSERAEHRWTAHLKHLRSHLDKLRQRLK